MPEKFFHRLCDAFDGSRSKLIYATDANLLPNLLCNWFRRYIADDSSKVTDMVIISNFVTGISALANFVSASLPFSGLISLTFALAKIVMKSGK